MAVSAIPAKSFLKAMSLPDDQRRKVLELLGAKMMDQLRAERESLQPATVREKLVAKST